MYYLNICRTSSLGIESSAICLFLSPSITKIGLIFTFEKVHDASTTNKILLELLEFPVVHCVLRRNDLFLLILNVLHIYCYKL